MEGREITLAQLGALVTVESSIRAQLVGTETVILQVGIKSRMKVAERPAKGGHVHVGTLRICKVLRHVGRLGKVGRLRNLRDLARALGSGRERRLGVLAGQSTRSVLGGLGGFEGPRGFRDGGGQDAANRTRRRGLGLDLELLLLDSTNLARVALVAASVITSISLILFIIVLSRIVLLVAVIVAIFIITETTVTRAGVAVMTVLIVFIRIVIALTFV